MKRDDSLQSYLIRTFIIILLAVSILEHLILRVLEVWILPLAEEFFHIRLNGTKMFSAGLLYLTVFLLIDLVLILIGLFLPNQIQWLIELSGKLTPNFEAISQISLLGKESRIKAFMLLLLMIAIVVMVIGPYVVSAFLYANLVVREFAKIEEAREAEKREFDRKRNLMLSDIAHDLRTPLTTIMGYATALSDGLIEDSGKKEEYLQSIRRKSERLSELSKLLFDYVRLDSEGYQLSREKLDISELLRSNIALYYTDFEEKGMELSINIPEIECILQGDRLQLSRVFSNLLTNALRHNESKTKLDISLEQQDGMILISFADTGTPIDPELAEKLFEPFTMADESRNSRGGSGLGLSIARKIVEMHGGSLDLEIGKKGFQKIFVIILKGQS